MTKKLLFIIAIFQSFLVHAQRYEWLSHATVSGANYNAPVAVDPAGNVFTLIGTGTSGAIIQGDTLPCLTPGEGVVIAKFDAVGNFLWGSMVNPNNGVIYGEKMAIDDAGAVYASIDFPNGGSANLGDTVFPVPGGAAGVIIKLDSSGHFINARSFSNNTSPRISCLGTDLFIGYGHTIAKLDSGLNTVWSITDATNTLNFAYAAFYRADIYVQANGELIADAYEEFNSTGDVPFGNDTVHFAGGSNDEIAVLKLDTSGQVLWTQALQLTTAGQPDVRAVCLDSHGNAYLGAGSINQQNVFGNDTLVNNAGPGPYGAVLKWDSTGNPVRGIGFYPVSTSVALYDLAVNAQDELLVSGDASGSISIDGDTVYPAGINFFLFKFSSAGTFSWWKDASSSPTGSLADGIAVRNGAEYVLGGSTYVGATFQFGCLSNTLTTPTRFVTLISEQPEASPVASFTHTVINDTSFTFINQSLNATSWHWDFGDGDTSNLENPNHDFAPGGSYTIILTAYRGSCFSSDTLQVTILVGIDEIESLSMWIAPNPSPGHFTLTLSAVKEDMSIEIFSVLGQRVFRSPVVQASQEINLHDIPGGVYLIKVFDGEKYYCKRMVFE